MQILNHLPIASTIESEADLDILESIATKLDQIIDRYETLIAQGDENNYNYWYLGLAYLLQEREIEAQGTWFMPFDGANELESIALNSELSNVLDRAATEEFDANNFDNSWLISQYLRELDPIHLNNLCRSILIEIQLERFTPDVLIEWEATELVSNVEDIQLDRNLLDRLLVSLILFPSSATADFIQACLLTHLTTATDSIDNLGTEIMNLAHRIGANSFLVDILNICLTVQPTNLTISSILCRIYSDLGEHQKAIDLGESICQLCESTTEKIRANYPLIITYLTAGNWPQAYLVFQRYQKIIEKFTQEKYERLDLITNQRIIVSNVFTPYTEDSPAHYRQLQNQLAQIYLQHNRSHQKNYLAQPAPIPKQQNIIRIGYIGSTLKSHSVGWLSRWLWQYHDREKFQIFTYCINQNSNDPFHQKWFRDRSHASYCILPDGERVAAQIRADEIDILIDLDSLTLNITCQVLAAKPAPVQVSWLGWDATGLSTVDYFIADSYVLPDNAQDYYQEKIWRLPQTYLAVNGFEVGIPTLKRQDLGIPDDAVVYWSGQRGFKRHPDTVRAQMQILKAVPNSYFIIKGDTDPTIIQEFFGEIAAEEGVEFDRLRFVGNVADEPTHRANLAMADVVLDTFPYNGATTTLETLWMGIPMVTQVGQQFAARNSYTFMLNAGIEEGIAWSQAEYIEWGIKLGLDRDLRDKIAGKLRSGRTTAPVWNAKQFTLDMEQAYREMWAEYQQQLNELN